MAHHDCLLLRARQATTHCRILRKITRIVPLSLYFLQVDFLGNAFLNRCRLVGRFLLCRLIYES